jgi:hypothetical protein
VNDPLLKNGGLSMLKNQMENIYKNTPLAKIPWNIETPPEILLDLIDSEKNVLTKTALQRYPG